MEIVTGLTGCTGPGWPSAVWPRATASRARPEPRRCSALFDINPTFATGGNARLPATSSVEGVGTLTHLGPVA